MCVFSLTLDDPAPFVRVGLPFLCSICCCPEIWTKLIWFEASLALMGVMAKRLWISCHSHLTPKTDDLQKLPRSPRKRFRLIDSSLELGFMTLLKLAR